MEKIVLKKSDLELLANSGKDVTIGKTKILVRPLPLAYLPGIMRAIADIRAEALIIIQDKKGDWQSCIVPIMELVAEQSPALAAELTGIEEDSFRQLPAAKALDILMTAVEVNLEASGDMIKKLIALAGRSKELTGVWTALNQDGQSAGPVAGNA